jgi:hypothetical protein
VLSDQELEVGRGEGQPVDLSGWFKEHPRGPRRAPTARQRTSA